MPTVVNGNRVKAVVAVVAVILSFGAGAVSSAFYFGGMANRLEEHVESRTIHEPAEAKERRIDSRVKLHLQPLLVELRLINERLARMEGK
jgi:hypothetical protein